MHDACTRNVVQMINNKNIFLVEQMQKACIFSSMTKTKRLNINRNWYKNKNVRPKLFNVTLARASDGSYRIVSGVVEAVVNQHEARVQRVDVRDLARDLNRARVSAL